MVKNSYVKENVVKNILILVVAIFVYPFISSSLAQIKPEQINDFLLVISMLLVTVCFANYAFTYEKSKIETKYGRLLAHFATGVYMLLTAFLLESIVIAVEAVYPFFHGIIFGFSILLYVGVVLYDFWDRMRV